MRTTNDYDVIVCGGGPAGVAAAIKAAETGARTLLVERLAAVGGMATGAFVSAWMDTPGGPVTEDLWCRLRRRGLAHLDYDPASHREPGRVRYHCESLKSLSLRALRDAGAEILLCTVAESAAVEDGVVSGVYVVNKAGRTLLRAAVVIDATADADIAWSAGAGYEQGDPDDGRLQHVNFRYVIEGVDRDRYQREKPADDVLIKWLQQAHKEGYLHPPTGIFSPAPELFPYHPPQAVLVLESWEIEGVNPCDPVQVSRTLVEAQLAAQEVVDFCREHLPGFEQACVGRLPEALGTRESRRIKGEYILTGDDVMAGRTFPDGITRAHFFIDFHDSPPGTTIPYSPEFKRANRPPDGASYEIPYRCLLPQGISGLLVAGRSISCDRRAQASLRVMPTCMFIGAAAGIAAAISVAEGIPPAQVNPEHIREKIMTQ